MGHRPANVRFQLRRVRRLPSRWVLRAAFLGGFLAAFCAPPASFATGTPQTSSRITWTETPGGQVKMEDKIPIMWDLYQPDKKDKKKDKESLVLVLLGRRYLMFDTKEKAVYEVKKSDLQAQGKDFTSDENLAATSRLIPTTDWNIRDVGAFEKVDVTLGDYGSALELQIPHPLILTPPLHYVY